MQKIFISYRRTDAEYAAGALGRELRRCFGDQQIFRDKEDIAGGARWKQQLLHEIDKDCVLLVLMGKDWANIKDNHGRRRLDNLDDGVRIEISDGIKDGAAIFPVLLENAQMPDESELPLELRRLGEFSALKLRDGDWQHDVDSICRTLEHAGFKPVDSAPQNPQSKQQAPTTVSKKGANFKGIIGAVLMVPVLLGFVLGLEREGLVTAAVLSAAGLVLGALAWRESRSDRLGIVVSILGSVGFLMALGGMTAHDTKRVAQEPEAAPGDTVTARKGDGLASLQLLGGHAVVRYDPGLWRLDANATPPGNFQYVYTGGDVFFRVITHPFQLQPETLADNGFLRGLQNSDPKLRVTRRDIRLVNGLDMVIREVEATVNGVLFRYYGHYYSDTSGSVEFIGWTYPQLIDEHRRGFEQFVSGFEVAGQKR